MKMLGSSVMLIALFAGNALADDILFQDAFKGKMDAGWRWLRETPEDWRITEQGLDVRPRPGDAETVRNALLRTIPETPEKQLCFEVTITFTTPLTEQYEQAGLVWYADDKPVFKLVHERIDGELFMIPGKVSMPCNTVRLRLMVDGQRYKASVQPEGEKEFFFVAEGDLTWGRKNEISLQCYHGPEQGDHWMRFSDFTITASPVK